MTTEAMLRFNNLTNELEMLRPEEFSLAFSYTKYLHLMNMRNKKNGVYC
jgi:hypothetical protein